MKVEEREKLYYNKYRYKLTAKVPGIYYTHNSNTIQDFRTKVESLRTSIRRPVYIPAEFNEDNYLKIEKIIEYVNLFDKNTSTIRKDANSISFFSNDLDLMKLFPLDNGKLFEVCLTPDGIKYFKTKVPALYRVYLSGKKVSFETHEEIRNYVKKNDNTLEASSSLLRWLNINFSWNYIWTSSTYYINYNDPTQLTMMHLMFPEALGKNYKLVKK